MTQPGRPAYNGFMNTTHPTTTAFLDALVARDFGRLTDAIAPRATMRALVPPGHLDWEGREQVAGRFTFWFGGTDDFEVLEQGAEDVGGRALLRWRFRLRQERLGDAWQVIEQVAFCDVAPDGLVERVDLLCSGFRAEAAAPAVESSADFAGSGAGA